MWRAHIVRRRIFGASLDGFRNTEGAVWVRWLQAFCWHFVFAESAPYNAVSFDARGIMCCGWLGVDVDEPCQIAHVRETACGNGACRRLGHTATSRDARVVPKRLCEGALAVLDSMGLWLSGQLPPRCEHAPPEARAISGVGWQIDG